MTKTDQRIGVPDYIGKWVKKSKYGLEFNLRRALKEESIDAFAEESKKVVRWLSIESNQEIFARAWLDGYKIEKKAFLVKLNGFEGGFNFLNYDLKTDRWFLHSSEEIGDCRTYHTDEELRLAGFGWVFDSRGVMIEEVSK